MLESKLGQLDAIELYRRAVELAPEDPQYREFLGQSLLKANRRDEALSVWRSIAEGSRRNRDNLIRVSEILAMIEESAEAIDLQALACEQNPRLLDRLRLAELLSESNRFEEATQQLNLARQPVEEDGEEDLFYKKQLEIFQAQGKMESYLANWRATQPNRDAERQAQRVK